jgi:ABC-type uncharacterized transport system permease subunit
MKGKKTKNHFLSHMGKPLEFFSSVFGLIINNCFLLYGIYILANIGGQEDLLERSRYLSVTAVVLISWGLLNVFSGGLVELGGLIESGEFESCLASPRSPLLIAAISKNNVVAIGEIFQGFFTICYLAWIGEYALIINILTSSICLCLSLGSVLIFGGTLSFFSSKGSQLSHVIIQTLILFSLFPISKALRGKERLFLYLTPAVLTVTLPGYVLSTGNVWILLLLFVSSLFSFLLSVIVFQRCLKFYTAKNYLFLKE